MDERLQLLWRVPDRRATGVRPVDERPFGRFNVIEIANRITGGIR